MRSFAQFFFANVFVYIYIYIYLITDKYVFLSLSIYIYMCVYIVCINVLIGDMIFKRRSMRIPQFWGFLREGEHHKDIVTDG